MNISLVSFGIAFVAGLASFLSPCMLPLVPIYLAQLVGQSVSQSAERVGPTRFTTFLHSVMFVLGFTTAFVALGATASTLGSLLSAYQFQLRQIGGVLLVIIGLHLVGILKLPFLYWQKRFELRSTRPNYMMSFVIGWTPCISLLLGSILGLAAAAATLMQGVLLLLVYSLGMGLPFLLLGLGLNQVGWISPCFMSLSMRHWYPHSLCSQFFG